MLLGSDINDFQLPSSAKSQVLRLGRDHHFIVGVSQSDRRDGLGKGWGESGGLTLGGVAGNLVLSLLVEGLKSCGSGGVFTFT